MAGKIEKTNVARLLDKAGVSYELVPYVVDENDLAATHIADQLGEPIERVFKTLVLCGDRTGHFVCVIPGNFEVDLKVAARISGNKSCEMLHMKELLPTTGYIRGGCSPIGMKKTFPTFVKRHFSQIIGFLRRDRRLRIRRHHRMSRRRWRSRHRGAIRARGVSCRQGRVSRH